MSKILLQKKVCSKSEFKLIVGCMFAGKTDLLIKCVRDLERHHILFQVFKPKINNRYIIDRVCSHSGRSVTAEVVTNSSDLMDKINRYAHTIFIDEVQFFGASIINVINDLIFKLKINVMATGIDTNFRGEVFPVIKQLQQHPVVQVTKLFGVCEMCGAKADRTQRQTNNRPSHYNEPVILVGGKEIYAPRCRVHHVVICD